VSVWRLSVWQSQGSGLHPSNIPKPTPRDDTVGTFKLKSIGMLKDFLYMV
jgi:hypothetical protein